MRRREFVTLVVSVACPLAAYPQSARIPVIGFLDPRSPNLIPKLLQAFREGLKETGHAEGENVTVEYRWAEDQIDQLPTLAADLGSTTDGRDCRSGKHCCGARGPCRDQHDTHCLRNRDRPCPTRTCYQPEPSWRQHHGCDHIGPRSRAEAIGAIARNSPVPRGR